jgi:hypothetical protein
MATHYSYRAVARAVSDVGVGVWSEVGVLIHPTRVMWDSGQDSGLGSPFLIVHKTFPHRTWFMAGSIVMLIQEIVIIEQVFYRRQYTPGQNALLSFCV